MDANIGIKIDDLQQPLVELTSEQMKAVVGGQIVLDIICHLVPTNHGTYDWSRGMCRVDEDEVEVCVDESEQPPSPPIEAACS